MSSDSNPHVASQLERRAEPTDPRGAFDRLAERTLGALLAGIFAGCLASFCVGAVWVLPYALQDVNELLSRPAGMLYFGLICVIYDAACIVALTVCATLASIVTLAKGHLGAIVLALLTGVAGFVILGIGDTDEIYPKPMSSYVSRAIGTAAAGYAAAYVARLRSN